MSYLILCNGTMTQNPFYFEFTNTKIYSIEELCYYIYNNIYIIEKKIFTKELANWIEKELSMTQLSNKLIYMISNDKSLKDIIVTILCSADYYFEKEIRELMRTIDKIEGLPVLMKKKIKADNFLRCHNYAIARKEYSEILLSKDVDKLDDVEYGNILHNLAIVKLNTSNFRSAAQKFKEAYLKNGNIESLKQYFYAIKLNDDEDFFRKEVNNLLIDKKISIEVSKKFARALNEAYNSDTYLKIKRLKQMKKDGRVVEYYDDIDELIVEWKKDYRREQLR